MQIFKRRKLSAEPGNVPDEAPVEKEEGMPSDNDSGSSSGAEPMSEDDDSPDTEEEIAGAQTWTKSKKTMKRKRRATSPSHFGAALQSLLETNAPSSLPLSLKPSAARKRHEEKLDVKAKKVIEVEKKEREEKNHVTDVIGGWGGESERALRKVAQRGVVKLFNAIQQSQSAAAATVEETKAIRGSGKPTLPAPVIDSKRKKGKPALVTGINGKSATLAQDDFLNMIKSGGVVSKK